MRVYGLEFRASGLGHSCIPEPTKTYFLKIYLATY